MRPRGAGLAADPDDVPGLNALVLEAWRVRSSRKYDARSASNSEAVGCVARGGDAELFAARAALECRGQLKLPQVWDEPADSCRQGQSLGAHELVLVKHTHSG